VLLWGCQCSETIDIGSSASPNTKTPEGVVAAFLETDLNGTSNEVIGDINKRMQFVTWEAYPGSDCFSVIKNYKITKISENAVSATVEAEFHEVGTLCGYDSYTANKVVEVVVFGLIKKGSVWKIDYPDPSPNISPLTALKIVEHELSRNYYSSGSKNIVTLRKRIELTRNELINVCNTLNLCGGK
jgi:hypothetical protein